MFKNYERMYVQGVQKVSDQNAFIQGQDLTV